MYNHNYYFMKPVQGKNYSYMAYWNFTKDYKNRSVVEGFLMNGKEWVTSPIVDISFMVDEVMGNSIRVRTLSKTTYILPIYLLENLYSSFSIPCSKKYKQTWNENYDYGAGKDLYSWSIEKTYNGNYYLVGYVDSYSKNQFSTTPIVSLIVNRDYKLQFMTSQGTIYNVDLMDTRFKNEYLHIHIS